VLFGEYMTREDFKKLAAGHYVIMMNGDKEKLPTFIEAAIWAFDYLNKNRVELRSIEPKEKVNVEWENQ